MRKIIIAIALLTSSPAFAQSASPIAPVAVGASYAQNFDTLASSGSSNALPAGFGIVEFSANADGAYAAGTGSSNAGGAYSFGAAGSADRALGALTSGSLSPVFLGGVFTNGQSATVTSLLLSYAGEQWRAASANSLIFEYSTNATSLQNGVWTRASIFDFVAPIVNTTSPGALDGNLAANRRVISGTLANLAIVSGGAFGLRWTMSDGAGADPALAIDDLSFTATTRTVAAVPEPTTWATMIVGLFGVGALLRRRGTARRFA